VVEYIYIYKISFKVLVWADLSFCVLGLSSGLPGRIGGSLF